MGVDIYVQCFSGGSPADVKTADLLRCFEPFIQAQNADWVDLVYGPHDWCTIYIDADEPSVSHFTISRPCSDRRLGECVYNAMQLGSFAVFIPGEDRVVVSSELAAADLPADVLEDGPIVVPRSLAEFQDLFYQL